jgi:signal transduction histidine kinase
MHEANMTDLRVNKDLIGQKTAQISQDVNRMLQNVASALYVSARATPETMSLESFVVPMATTLNETSEIEIRLKLKKNLPSIAEPTMIQNPLLSSHPLRGKILTTLIRDVIFSHLLQNSWRAGASRMEIRTSRITRHFIIDIKDNGCGIKRENVDKLFQKGATFPYRNHGNIVHGMGYGLYDSNMFMKCVRGDIQLVWNSPIEEDAVNHGASFRLFIPISGNKTA